MRAISNIGILYHHDQMTGSVSTLGNEVRSPGGCRIESGCRRGRYQEWAATIVMSSLICWSAIALMGFQNIFALLSPNGLLPAAPYRSDDLKKYTASNPYKSTPNDFNRIPVEFQQLS